MRQFEQIHKEHQSKVRHIHSAKLFQGRHLVALNSPQTSTGHARQLAPGSGVAVTDQLLPDRLR